MGGENMSVAGNQERGELKRRGFPRKVCLLFEPVCQHYTMVAFVGLLGGLKKVSKNDLDVGIQCGRYM